MYSEWETFPTSFSSESISLKPVSISPKRVNYVAGERY